MFKGRRCLLFIALVILPLVLAGCARQITGEVLGQIRDADGLPMTGAVVAVGKANAVVNEQGVFSITKIPAGDQVLTVSVDGIEVYELPVRISGTPLRVNITVTATGAMRNLIRNFDFSMGTDATGAPTGWVLYQANSAEANTTLSDEKALIGKYAAKLVDTSDTKPTGIRSEPYAAQAGDVFRAEVGINVESRSTFMIYLEFNDDVKRLDTATARIGATTAWTTIVAENQAPAGTTNVTVLLYSGGSNLGTAYYDNIRLYKVN